MTPARPLLRYLGAKWRMAPRIIELFPPHDLYVEVFGGSAAVLLRKEPSKSEIWNDLDDELCNLFFALREHPEPLLRAIWLTPYSRREYVNAFEACSEPVERARRLLVRSHMAFGSNSARLDRNPGFRRDGPMTRTRVAGEWGEFPDALRVAIERLKKVHLESCPAADLIASVDAPNALLFVDPPYLPATRSQKCKTGEGYHAYAHEMSPAEHAALLDQLVGSKSMVVLSGYASDLYDEKLGDWARLEVAARSQNNAPRTEVLWINPRAVDGARTLFAA